MRRNGMAMWMLAVAVALAVAIRLTAGAVLSVDLGSEWMKVAVVQLKAGQSPIAVAINEMSKRKSPAAVAFHSGNRLIGEEAAGIAGRFPEKVVFHCRDMLGLPAEHARLLADSVYLPYNISSNGRGSPSLNAEGSSGDFCAEELVAMILSYARSLGEAHAKEAIKDAVISVPPFFGQTERIAMLQAAQLAGINVLALLNEHAGAAIQYGFDKDFSNASRYVVFYDMGANSVYAALVHFSAYTTKEFGKNASVNQFQVKDVKWNANLGGQSMEMRLVEYFVNEFNKQLGNTVDVRNFPKAMAKLKKQVKRTKEILSANTEAPLSVESLYDDRDFRSSITRQKYEELCADLFEKALQPVKDVLKDSKLSLEDIYAVELIGGATRTPKLQAMLQDFLGRRDLDRHLDADEAIVLGSALHAANLSDGIKLTRKLGMIDGAMYGIVLEVNVTDTSTDISDNQLLIPRMKKLPSKLFRSVQFQKDFELSLHYDQSEILPPGVSSNKIASYLISGLTETYTKYASRNLSSPIKTNLHFSLSRSGVVSFDRAETIVEISEWIDVPVKNLTVENSTSTLNTSTEASALLNSTDDKVEASASNEGSNTTVNSEAEKEPAKTIAEKKLRKRTFRMPLKIVDITKGPVTSLSKEQLLQSEIRLRQLDRKDAERKRTAELKNSLEEYIYSTREKLETMEDIAKFSTEEELSSFKGKLEEAQEWLYTDGEDASADEFEKQLQSLKAVGEEIFFRVSELSARPAACSYARQIVDGFQKIVDDWEKSKPWISQSLKDEILNESDKFRKWLQEKEDKQSKTPAYVAPIFTSEEVHQRVEKLQEKVIKIGKTPKPKPRVPAAETTDPEKSGSQKDTSSENTTQSDQGAAGEQENHSSDSVEHNSDMEKPSSDGSAGSEERFDEL